MTEHSRPRVRVVTKQASPNGPMMPQTVEVNGEPTKFRRVEIICDAEIGPVEVVLTAYASDVEFVNEVTT